MRTVNVPRGVLLASLVMVLALVAPAIAAPLGPPAPDPYPRIAFVARNDVPFDSLAIGPIAGAVGGVIAITSPSKLSVPAATILTEFGPDLVVIAGGVGAVSQAVEDEITALGSWDVDRAAGKTRDETAREIARLLEEYGLDRPAMLSTSSGQNVGDLYLGGHLTAQGLTVIEPIAPIIWSSTDVSGTPYPYDEGSVVVVTLEIDVPADDGVLAITASSAVRNEDDDLNYVNAFILLDTTLDEASPDDILLLTGFDAAAKVPNDFAPGGDDELAVNEIALSFSGVRPITAGPHVLRFVLSGGLSENVTAQMPSLLATWYPAASVGSVAVVE